MRISIAIIAGALAASTLSGCSEGASPQMALGAEAQMPEDVLALHLTGPLTTIAAAPVSGSTKDPVRYYLQGEALFFVTDMTRSARFYGETLRLPADDGGGPSVGLSPLPTEGADAAGEDVAFGSPDGRIVLRPASGPIAGANETDAVGWIVADVAAVAQALAARGVSATRFAGVEQDAFGVWTAPNGDRLLWFADPDGYPLAAVQPKLVPRF